MANNSAPRDANYSPELAGLSPSNGWAAIQLGATTATDSATGNPYAPVVTQAVAPNSVSATLQSAAAANGNGTPFTLLGNSSVILTVNMTGFTGTVNFEGQEDGTDYGPLLAVQLGLLPSTIVTTAVGSATTAIQLYEISVAGLQAVRARISSYSAGSVTVTAHAVPGSFSARVVNVANVAQFGGQVPSFAGSDGQTASTTDFDAMGVYNGTTIDRLKGDGGVARVSLQAQGTPVTGSAAVAANTSNSASLPAVSAKTNYITGFSVTTQGGSGAAAGAVTVTGTITGTLTFEVGAAANNPVQVYVQFPNPIPASAVNTAITVNVPALGATTGAAACTIYGFVQ